jgi:hypothetical protein
MFADAAGTVIIPSRLLDDAFDMAHNTERQDFEFIEAIRNEDPEEVRRRRDLLQTGGRAPGLRPQAGKLVPPRFPRGRLRLACVRSEEGSQ